VGYRNINANTGQNKMKTIPSQTVQASIVKIARPDKAKQWLPPNDAGRERGKFF
jgi:hypothetical protein